MPEWKRTGTGVLGGLAGLVGLSVAAGILVTMAVTPAIAVTGAAASNAITVFNNLPDNLKIETPALPSAMYYKDAKGKDVLLAKYYDQNRIEVTYDQIAPVMYDAILSSEDPRFYQHGAIDLFGTTRAVLSNLKGGAQTQGGSSISQQYVKNVLVQQCYSDVAAKTFKDDKTSSADQKRLEAENKCYYGVTTSEGSSGIQRKLEEMRKAIALEKTYSKKAILVQYLNITNFGGTTYGIEAAAQYYFGVHAKDLTLEQAATLAGMVKSPNDYRIDQLGSKTNGTANHFAVTKERQSYVLYRMKEDGKISAADYEKAKAAPIVPHITPSDTGCQAAAGKAYFCRYAQYVLENSTLLGQTKEESAAALKRGGLKIYTSLDPALQAAAEKTMKEHAPSTVKGIKFGSTIVNVQPGTGNILSIAQNTKFSEDPAVTRTNAAYKSIVYAGDQKYGGSNGFPAGSTFKLFTLLDWLKEGHSLRDNLDGTLHVFKKIDVCGQTVYNNDLVHNFGNDRGFRGTPLRFTARSLNTGFFAMAEQLDFCKISQTAADLGVTYGDGTRIDMKNLYDVIGSANVSPIAMAAAYATVANKGEYCAPRIITEIQDSTGQPLTKATDPQCSQVLDPGVAAAAAYALQGVMRGEGSGTQARVNDGTPVLGKTGTHETYQTWMIQSSTAVTTAVWVGLTDHKKNDKLADHYFNGRALNTIRYVLSKDVMTVANQRYKGGPFPEVPDQFNRPTPADLPNVVGMTVPAAQKLLEDAGFIVKVGAPKDSASVAKDLIAEQTPSPGKVDSGSTVTIIPSTGMAPAPPTTSTVPNVLLQPIDVAISMLKASGFNVIARDCQPTPGGTGTVIEQNPLPGTMADPNTRITLKFQNDKCNGGGGG